MKIAHILPLCLLAAVTVALAAPPAKVPAKLPNGERPWPEPDADDTKQIVAAVPTRAPAAPAKPRRLLVFYRTDGFPHASIPYWNKLIVEMGRQTGAYTATLSQSYDDLTTEKLQDYDAVFFNNTCRMNTPEPVKAALQAFIRNGKGFAGNHGAGDNWHDWPEGKEMIGGEFVTHPYGRIQIKVDDATSPLTAVFEGKGFPYSDEIYAFTEPYSREKLHVLLSIDYPNSPEVAKAEQRLRERAAAPAAKDGEKRDLAAARADHDYALAWIRSWGKGRLFYCALGHRPSVTFEPAMAKFYLAGIQYALGDLKADDSPSGSAPVAPAVPLKEANATPGQDPAKSEQAVTVLHHVRFDPAFEFTTFAAPPMVNSPVFVSAAPDGTLYVSSDPNGLGATVRGVGRIVRLRDTDGDGVADTANDFVKVDSPRGLVVDGNTVYVLHPPHLSAFTDKDGDGVSDEERILVKNIGWSFTDRPADHASNGVELGIDGWIYAAIGDFGFMEAEGTDGRKLQLRGGGVVRVRPDGTGLELYSVGTRNILEAAISPLLDGFARDNTNDGGGWNIRFHHFTGGEDHGYPRLYKNFADETVKPLADYGGGSGCGAAWVSEPGWPAAWNQRPYTVDWGRQFVAAHEVRASGATFVEPSAARESRDDQAGAETGGNPPECLPPHGRGRGCGRLPLPCELGEWRLRGGREVRGDLPAAPERPRTAEAPQLRDSQRGGARESHDFAQPPHAPGSATRAAGPRGR